MSINDTVDVRVVMDPRAIAAFIRSPDGPIMRDLVIRATRVQDAARRQIRLGHVGGGEANANANGRPNLRYTLVKRVIPRDSNPSVLVGSDSPIALLHHEGTAPHIIRPRDKSSLVFWSNKSNSLVFAKIVHHPGTKPNRYLTDNLHLALQS